jgi:hypothetical protein
MFIFGPYSFDSREQINEWVSDHYGVDENSEGTVEERIVAGWVNAMDIEEDRKTPMSEGEFFSLVRTVVAI